MKGIPPSQKMRKGLEKLVISYLDLLEAFKKGGLIVCCWQMGITRDSIKGKWRKWVVRPY